MNKKFLVKRILTVSLITAMMFSTTSASAFASLSTDDLSQEVAIELQVPTSETIALPTTAYITNVDSPVQASSIVIKVDGKEIAQSSSTGFAEIKEGRTMVPLRVIGEALSYKVDWDDATKTVTMSNSTKSVKHQIGTTFATDSTGTKSDIGVISYIDGPTGRTLVPIRLIAESMGCTVNWVPNLNAPGGTVEISTSMVDRYGNLNETASKGYVMDVMNSLRFYEEGGKYYVEGELPVLPAELKSAGLMNLFYLEFIGTPGMKGAIRISTNYPDKKTTIPEDPEVLSMIINIAKEGKFKVEVPEYSKSNAMAKRTRITDDLIVVTYSVEGKDGANQKYSGYVRGGDGYQNYLDFNDGTKQNKEDFKLNIEWK